MTDAKEIARYIVSYYSSAGDDDLTHMKLHKLLYYIQAECLKYVIAEYIDNRLLVLEDPKSIAQLLLSNHMSF